MLTTGLLFLRLLEKLAVKLIKQKRGSESCLGSLDEWKKLHFPFVFCQIFHN
jgi:hypothetical protein